MTITEIIRIVISETGHFELVRNWENNDLTDNGILRQINYANRYLDVNFPVDIYNKSVYIPIQPDKNLVSITPIRFIKAVNLIDDNNKKSPVNYTNVRFLRTQQEKGKPYLFYRLDIEDEEKNKYSICLYPIPDKKYTLEVYGNVYDIVLRDDNTESYWSVNYPELLIEATKMAIEHNLHRNYEAEMIYKTSIERALTNIYYKLCQEEFSGDVSTYEKGKYSTKSENI